jgi:dTDP-4-amino-4,6-dideoxygalactose transaminase
MPQFPFLVPRRMADLRPGDTLRLAAPMTPQEGETCVARWEAAVADYVGAPCAVAVNSGRQGMTAILRHLGAGEGTEVIIPAYTLAGLVPLITGLGARAIPADIDPVTLNVCPDALEARITPRTRAILVLHAFGAAAPMDAIMAIARARGVAVVEDCAHALGAAFKGQKLGTFGHAGFYSFEPTKPVNTYGGGMVVTADAALAGAIRREESAKPADLDAVRRKAASARREQWLMRTGLARPLLHLLAWPAAKRAVERAYRSVQQVPPAHCRYTPEQAAIGLEKLADLDARLARRQAHAARVAELLAPDVAIQGLLPDTTSTWYFLALRLTRDAAPVRARLLWSGIDAAVAEEVADDCAALLGVDDCPQARRAFSQTLVLPLYDAMPDAVIERIAAAARHAVAHA